MRDILNTTVVSEIVMCKYDTRTSKQSHSKTLHILAQSYFIISYNRLPLLINLVINTFSKNYIPQNREQLLEETYYTDPYTSYY